MVRQKYKDYARPLARVVHGLPVSWEPVATTMYHDDLSGMVAWSPCNRLIAFVIRRGVEIRDAVTLNLLSTFKSPSNFRIRSLCFSPNGCFLTHLNHQDLLTWDLLTWDLQTGGSVHTILPKTQSTECVYPPSSYSMDGRMLAFLSWDTDTPPKNRVIITHDLSASHTHRYRVSEGRIILPTWTHGEFLRFATAKAGCIIIWEVGFAFTRAPEMVESFPLPDEIARIEAFESPLFLPTLYRLAVVLENTLFIWDARGSKLLLKLPPRFLYHFSFSPDGRFFACAGDDVVGIWKGSPAGYILHQQLSTTASFGKFVNLVFSPNGEAILISVGSTIHLLHTGDPILSGGSTSSPKDFILAFSTDETSVAFARYLENTITIIDLQSGGPQLTIDTGIQVRGLRVTGSTIAVVDLERIVSWNLGVGSGGANINDAVRDTSFNSSSPSREGKGRILDVSISPDLSHVATLRRTRSIDPAWVIRPNRGREVLYLEFRDALTGRCLASTIGGLLVWGDLRFSPDGREVWFGLERGWGVIVDSESGATKLQPLERTQCPPEALPWLSCRGYEVKDDGWILSPTQKRLLWLPHRWRSHERYRTWSGRFLALGYHELPEVVILEFFE